MQREQVLVPVENGSTYGHYTGEVSSEIDRHSRFNAPSSEFCSREGPTQSGESGGQRHPFFQAHQREMEK